MVHGLVLIFFVAAAIVVTLVLFAFWLLITFLRGLTRLILGPGLKKPAAPPQQQTPATRSCPRDGCRATNYSGARFCRRCGQQFDPPQRVPARRVAMF